MFKTDQAKGLFLTTLGALTIVPDSLFVRLIQADGLVVAFWRAILVGAGVMLFSLLMKGPDAFKAVFRAGFPGVFYIFVVGLSGVMFIVAVSLTSVANVVFIIATMPVFAAVFSRIILGEAISGRMMITIMAVFPGLAIIAYGSGQNESTSFAGDLAALSVSMLYALALTMIRKVKAVFMVPAVGLGYFGAGVVLYFFTDPFSVPLNQSWLVLLHAAFIAASATFMALGPRYIPSAEVALLILLESVLAPILVWAVVGEDPGAWTLVGGAVVLSALGISNYLALRAARRRPVPPLPH
jgi:drug/metabolite transporter (DMT)-like permease